MTYSISTHLSNPANNNIGTYTEKNSKIGNFARKLGHFFSWSKCPSVHAKGASEGEKLAAKLNAAKNQLLNHVRYIR